MIRALSALLVLAGCSEQQLNAGGPDAAYGDGYNGPQHCWDLDYDGEADPDEDTNDDGTVDVYDCRGEDGSGSGADGQDCWDLDGDGVGDPEEDTNGDGFVDVYDCRDDGGDDTGGGGGDAYFGDITFNSDASMVAFCDRYDVVYGNVNINLGIQDTTPLACIRVIDGNLSAVGHDTLSVFRFSNLQRVTGSVRVGVNPTPVLSVVELPLLEEVGEDLIVSRCDSLVSLSLPTLSTVGRDFYAQTAESLEEVDAPALANIGGLFALTALPSLFLVDVTQLLMVDGLSIQNTPSLTSLSKFSALQGAGDVNIRGFGGVSLAGLEAVRTVSSLEIRGNPSLTDVTALHGVTSISPGSLRISSNPSLSSSAVDALVAAIGEGNIAGAIENYGNGG